MDTSFCGSTSGYFTAISDAYRAAKGPARNEWYVDCVCACGRSRRLTVYAFTRGRSSSCGCAKFGTPLKPGDRFGRLTIIAPAETSSKGLAFLCRCDCGNEKVVLRGSLTSGTTRSCGCYRRECGSATAKHGGHLTRLYRIWIGMRFRCRNPRFRYYGDRGVRVCDEWDSSFVAFRDWAMANGYSPNLTIDRIDTNGHYEPANCRWADSTTQSNNRRNNRRLTVRGETKTLHGWVHDPRCTVCDETLERRLRDGWAVEEAVLWPPYQSKGSVRTKQEVTRA